MTSAGEARAAVEEVFASLAPHGANLEWDGSTTIYVTVDGAVEGLSIDLEASIARIRAQVADRFQTIFIESTHELTPACPRHPTQHPLECRIVADEAVWRCPGDEVTIRAV
jgi:hypothetical protein